MNLFLKIITSEKGVASLLIIAIVGIITAAVISTTVILTQQRQDLRQSAQTNTEQPIIYSFPENPEFEESNTINKLFGDSSIKSKRFLELNNILNNHNITRIQKINNINQLPSSLIEYNHELHGEREVKIPPVSISASGDLNNTYILYSSSPERIVRNDINSTIYESPSFNASSSNYYVQPVVFFPADYSRDSEVISHINNAVRDIKDWYSSNNNGKTFNYKAIKVIEGNQESQEYWCSNICSGYQFYSNVIAELKSNNIRIFDSSAPNIIYMVVAMGGGGYAGAVSAKDVPGGTIAMVGDISIYPEIDGNCSRIKNYYYQGDPINSKDQCESQLSAGNNRWGTGTIAHELGHTFDLPHPDALDPPYPPGSDEFNNSLMGNHSPFPNTSLLPEERSILASSQFVNNSSSGGNSDGQVGTEGEPCRDAGPLCEAGLVCSSDGTCKKPKDISNPSPTSGIGCNNDYYCVANQSQCPTENTQSPGAGCAAYLGNNAVCCNFSEDDDNNENPETPGDDDQPPQDPIGGQDDEPTPVPTGVCATQGGIDRSYEGESGHAGYVGPRCNGEEWNFQDASNGVFDGGEYTDVYRCNDGTNDSEDYDGAHDDTCSESPWTVDSSNECPGGVSACGTSNFQEIEGTCSGGSWNKLATQEQNNWCSIATGGEKQTCFVCVPNPTIPPSPQPTTPPTDTTPFPTYPGICPDKPEGPDSPIRNVCAADCSDVSSDAREIPSGNSACANTHEPGLKCCQFNETQAPDNVCSHGDSCDTNLDCSGCGSTCVESGAFGGKRCANPYTYNQ